MLAVYIDGIGSTLERNGLDEFLIGNHPSVNKQVILRGKFIHLGIWILQAQ